jgi:tetratricopeptide (TPR) repeat protein
MSEQIIHALKQGDAKHALALAEAMVEQMPSQSESYYWLALAYQGLAEKTLALSAIDNAIALAPDQNDYAMIRSVMLLGDADLATAQSGLMDTLALNPNQLDAYVGLIHIAVAQKNIPEAKRVLKLAERVNDNAIEVLIAKGSIAQAEGNIDNALNYYTQASAINPNHALALSSMGICYLHKHMPVFAEQALKRASAQTPKNIGILRALLQSQLDQELLSDAEQTLSSILHLTPDDAASLQLRNQLRHSIKDGIGALDDAYALYALRPNDVHVLAGLCTQLIQAAQFEKAQELLQAALDKNMDSDALWQLHWGFESAYHGNGQAIIDAWLNQLPESALAHEALAVYLESINHLDASVVAVDKALLLSENLPLAQFVKLRHEFRDNPQHALIRAEQLAHSANNPESQRMIQAWLGLINDHLGQFERAADAFKEMVKFVLPLKTLPTPSPAMTMSTAPELSGRLLWAPTGARIERVFNVLAPELGANLLIDRNQPTPAREVGFGPIRAQPNSPDAGTALNWQMGILALGLQTSDVVDWIPHWDAYTAEALRGTELLTLVIDPRDALLNWMVFGSAQSYVFPPHILQSAKWLAAAYHAIADTIAHGPQKVHVVYMDNLDTAAQQISLQLQQALHLNNPPNVEQLAKPVRALGGMPNQFPAGHWRHYQSAFHEAFAVLSPAAVRLGYPET